MKFAARVPARFLRFCVVGASSVAVDFGTLALLTGGAGWPPLAANPISFTLGVTNGFYWNRRWTFSEPGRATVPAHRYGRFVLVNLVGAGLDQGFLALALALAPSIGLDDEPAKWAGKLAGIPASVAWNYIVNSRWTFGA